MARNYTVYNKTITTTSTNLVEAVDNSSNRQAIIISNIGDTPARISINEIEASYIILYAGDAIHLPVAPMNSVNAFTESGTTTISVFVS